MTDACRHTQYEAAQVGVTLILQAASSESQVFIAYVRMTKRDENIHLDAVTIVGQCLA